MASTSCRTPSSERFRVGGCRVSVSQTTARPCRSRSRSGSASGLLVPCDSLSMLLCFRVRIEPDELHSNSIQWFRRIARRLRGQHRFARSPVENSQQLSLARKIAVCRAAKRTGLVSGCQRTAAGREHCSGVVDSDRVGESGRMNGGLEILGRRRSTLPERYSSARCNDRAASMVAWPSTRLPW